MSNYFASPVREIFHSVENENIKQLDLLDNLIFFIIDTSFEEFLYIGQSIEKITGYSAESLQNKGVERATRLIHPFDYSIALRAELTIKEFISEQTRGCWKGEFRIRHRSGKWIWLESRLIHCCDSVEPYIIGILRDISDKKDQESFLWQEVMKREKSPTTVRRIKQYYQRISEKFNQMKFNPGKEKTLSEENYQISKREMEVLKLIADGFSTKLIADKLFISKHTVINHRKNLLSKFKAKNTAELVKKAMQTYWL